MIDKEIENQPQDEARAQHNHSTEKPDQRDNMSQQVIAATKTAILFHDEDNEPCAAIPVNGHMETHRMKSRAFQRWVSRQVYQSTGKVPSTEARTSALHILEAKALFDGDCHKLEYRVAKKNDEFLYDLGDISWSVVSIRTNGWSIENKHSIFRRSNNTAPQVKPIPGGNIRDVLRFVNFKNERDKNLFLVKLVSDLIPEIPHPATVFVGEHGAAKSTITRINRRLVDPAVQELNSIPKDLNEFALQLSKNYAPSYDNLDGMQSWQSDMLCRAVTGGGVEKRKLFTDDEGIILKFKRCVVLNGINPAVTRSDLIDRTILLVVERIPPEHRKDEISFMTEFESARPSIFGGMLDAVSAAMSIYPKIQLSRLPRMADFCKWGYAIAEVLEIGGEEFLKNYWENIDIQNEVAIESHPVASAVVSFMSSISYWEGRPSDLLVELENVADHEKIDRKARTWPKDAHILTRRLREIKSNLLEAGVEVITGERQADKRRITLRKIDKSSVTSVNAYKHLLSGGGNEEAARSPLKHDESNDDTYGAPSDTTHDGNDADDAS